jgi:hypothetical protein
MKVIRVVFAIGTAIVVSLLVELPFQRYPFGTPATFKDYYIRVFACSVGVAVSGLIWDRRQSLIISVVVIYLMMDAQKIAPYFALDRLDWYPFRFLPLAWAKVAWVSEFITATLIGSLLGKFLGREVRRRVFRKVGSMEA